MEPLTIRYRAENRLARITPRHHGWFACVCLSRCPSNRGLFHLILFGTRLSGWSRHKPLFQDLALAPAAFRLRPMTGLFVGLDPVPVLFLIGSGVRYLVLTISREGIVTDYLAVSDLIERDGVAAPTGTAL